MMLITLCLHVSFPEMTVEKLDAFIPQLLSKLYIEGLIYGNVTKQVGCISSHQSKYFM